MLTISELVFKIKAMKINMTVTQSWKKYSTHEHVWNFYCSNAYGRCIV